MILRNGRELSPVGKPYIIAELNSSHNGNVGIAKMMIDAAKECGCDCVKFQSWTDESLYSEEWREANAISSRVFKKVSLSEERLAELAEYCKVKDIDFSSTPYSKDEVDFLADRVNAPFIKIASMEIDNIPYLKYIGSKGVPIILSTGMSVLDEIRDAVKAIESTGNRDICILHCVSVYPAGAEIISLNNMRMLQNEFPEYTVGYSDHTAGYEIAAAAIALGASVIEKHFTLDSSKMGMDNSMATEPEKMKELVRACYNVWSAMGTYERVLTVSEKEQIKKMRRSVIAASDLEAGHVLDMDDMDAKRPGDGISPIHMDEMVGRKLRTTIRKGYKITVDDLE